MKFEKACPTVFSHFNFLANIKKSNIYDAGFKKNTIFTNLFLLPVHLIYRLVQHAILKIIQKFCSGDYKLTNDRK